MSDEAPSGDKPDALSILYPDDVPKTDANTGPVSAAPREILAAPDKPRETVLYPEDQRKDERPPEASHGAPDRSYTLEIPEGLAITKEIMAEVEPVFRELNLSDAGASRLMPLAAKFYDRIIDGMAEEAEAMRAGWARQATRDPELGGGNWAQTEHAISVALKAAGATRGSPFMKLLEESGLGNHPEMVRALRNIGSKLDR